MNEDGNMILPPEMLEDSPSRRDGISAAIEKAYRRKTTTLMDQFAKALGWYVILSTLIFPSFMLDS